MASTYVPKHWNLFIQGVGQAGKVKDFKPPVFKAKLEDYQAGGMLAPIGVTVGHEKLSCEWTGYGLDPAIIGLWGLAEGHKVAVEFREVLEDHDGNQTLAIYKIRGKLTTVDVGTRGSGGLAEIKYAMDSVAYFKLIIGGRDIEELDIENMLHAINGSDLKAVARGMLGI